MDTVSVGDEIWSIYQDVGHNHDEIINDPKHRKEFIDTLRNVADSLESTLPKATVDILYLRNNLDEIDTAGYRTYLYQFENLGDEYGVVTDRALEHCIISSPDMDKAIKAFETICNVHPELYEGITVQVELIGADFSSQRVYPVLMTKYNNEDSKG